jgi:DNA-3-methyladenine glycosylase
MFGPPGRAYVYAIHSRWCFNVVTEPRGVASAVLVRAVEPVGGIALMQRRRGQEKLTDLTRGPGRLCEAFGVHRSLDGWKLNYGRRLWIATDHDGQYDSAQIGSSERIGVTSAEHLPLRFYIRSNPYVSGPKRLRI